LKTTKTWGRGQGGTEHVVGSKKTKGGTGGKVSKKKKEIGGEFWKKLGGKKAGGV